MIGDTLPEITPELERQIGNALHAAAEKGKTRSASLQPIKELVGKKQKMRRRNYYLCDSCDDPIYNPEDGYVVHGNIYVADPDVSGGLIGNNFPEGDAKFSAEDVGSSVYCRKCLLKALNLEKQMSGFVPRANTPRTKKREADSDEAPPF